MRTILILAIPLTLAYLVAMHFHTADTWKRDSRAISNDNAQMTQRMATAGPVH